MTFVTCPKVVKNQAWFWCEEDYVLVVHGDGIGLERAIAANKDGGTRNAFHLLEQQSLEKYPETLPLLSASGWVVTAYFQIPQNNPNWRVCGDSDWTGDPQSGLKRRYAIIAPIAATVEWQVKLRITPLSS
ncbi:MAG: hypothetical protein ACE5R6_17435 [Candidatus Heimdallarchaeota archaeon]